MTSDAPKADSSQTEWTRREFVQVMAGLGVATGAAFGGWGMLEVLKAEGNDLTPHNWSRSCKRASSERGPLWFKSVAVRKRS